MNLKSFIWLELLHMLSLWPSQGILHFKTHPFTWNKGLIPGHVDGRPFYKDDRAIFLHDITETFVFTVAVYNSICQCINPLSLFRSKIKACSPC